LLLGRHVALLRIGGWAQAIRGQATALRGCRGWRGTASRAGLATNHAVLRTVLGRLLPAACTFVLCGFVLASPAAARTTPLLSSTASGGTTVGLEVFDNVNVLDGSDPTGSLTFDLYGPDDPTCANAPAFTSTVAVNDNGSYNSAALMTTAAGTYEWRASYSGDANNNPVGPTSCSDPGESVIVAKFTAALTTTASPSTVVGKPIHDTASFNGLSPTGTISFQLSGPTDTFCGGPPVFTADVPITAGSGSYSTPSFTPTQAGTYRWQASYGGDAENGAIPISSCLDPEESVVVTKAVPTLSSSASASVALGGAVSDTATIAAGSAPTGTITFQLFGPADPQCTGAPAFTSTVPVSGNGSYKSGPFTAAAPGTYLYVASYSGDLGNAPVTSACGDRGESVVVLVAGSTPSLSTTASPTVAVGGAVSDAASISGGLLPTGTITFRAFGPANASCTGTPAFTSTVTVSGDGTYRSAAFTPGAAGTYLFVAAYSGDAGNASVTAACGAGGESVVVSRAATTVVTHASAAVTVGGTVSDTATLAGAFNASGTITFEIFGPGDTTCSRAAAFTSTVPVAGNGSYGSGPFTPAAAGTYAFEAAYSGDANNLPSGPPVCADPGESVVVSRALPVIATQASAPVVVGGQISDTATLSSGIGPTGTISFRLFGPGDAACSGPPAFTSTVAVTGDGRYVSGPFTTGAAGTYSFVAAYSGDATNAPVTAACADPAESVLVSRSSTAVVTHASVPITAGGQISDTATLSGGSAPSGAVTFELFGPDDVSCSSAPAFTSVVPVNGDGDYGSGPFTPVAAGTYRYVATYGGDANNSPAGPTACADPAESVLVSPAAPAVAGRASAPVAVGGAVSDTATLSGGLHPGGTITFELFGPADAACAGTPAFTSTAPVNGDGSYASSPFAAAVAPGTYSFVASYSGDPANSPTATACGDPAQSVVVSRATAALVTSASAPVAIGGQVSDTATLSGGFKPTGTLSFALFGPGDASCAGAPVFTSTAAVAGDGSYRSGSFTTSAVGTYSFVASYSGDASNVGVATACEDPAESVVVSRASAGLVTQASGAVALGGVVSDTATVSGGFAPSGTVRFALFGPGDATCAGVPVFTSTAPVSGDGAYASAPFTPTAAGTYSFVASYSGDASNAPAAGACADPAESVVVSRASAAIGARASPPIAVGGQVSDTATLSGGASPTGTVRFALFGPGDATCSGVPAFTSTVPVNGDGSYVSSPFTPTAAGTYSFVASYSGDANTVPVATACGDPAESVVVSRAATLVVVTSASSPVALGGQVSDTATLSGGFNPTGTVEFALFGPGDAGCTGVPAFVSSLPLTGNGSYTSTPFTPTAVGTYSFVASYPGDANNAPVVGACGDPAESVVVSRAIAAIVTQASSPVAVGGQVSDMATVSGGVSPSGTVTFALFGPGDATCAGVPAFTSTVQVSGDGRYSSAPFTPTVVGTYSFVASYSGDASNVPIATRCGDPAESVVVSVASAAVVTTRASAPVGVGGVVTDTAALSGGFGPSGSITFALFGPGDTSCTGAPAFTSTVPVGGDGSYSSAPFTTSAVGTYSFVASYSGDANNAPVATRCGDPAESVVVSPASAAIVTQASSPVAVGGTVSDAATLAAGFNPTGSITFALFGPGDAACSGVPAFTSTVPVSGDGSYVSTLFMPTVAGTYSFVASYSGDPRNAPVAGACGDPAESVVVSRASTVVVTSASGPVAVGGQVSDAATVSGGFSPSGTVTFALFGPGDATCTGTPAFTSTVQVSGDGRYSSSAFAPTAVGTYSFVASYSGDANNAPVAGACGDPAESVVVSRASTVAVLTRASAPVAVGGTVSDAATLSGGFDPSGMITFALFGPGDASCEGAPLFTSTAAVAGDGSYSSAPFTTSAVGTYSFVASYSGDASNAPVATACGDPAESVVVSRASTVVVVTKASAPVAVGGAVSDTATVSGGFSPSGTMTFALFGPGDASCSGVPAFTSTVPVSGDGSYSSAAFKPSAVGSYSFTASYSGDVTNAPVATACGDPAESVVVSRSSTVVVVTKASGTAAVGGAVSDTATVSSGFSPSGTVTFALFGPGDATCTGAPAFTSTVPVSGDGSYVSAPFTPTAVGTYSFTASYSGDASNAPVATACGDPAESVVVSRAIAAIVTRASAPVAVGGVVSDTATLSGGFGPSGTVTFALFGPGAATCTGAPVFTSTVPVSGDGSYVSAPFTPAAVGTYSFTASYSGDVTNAPVATACGDPAESVLVSRSSTVVVVTKASGAVAVGGQVSDTATLSGGFGPSGTVTFALFGPGAATCTGAPVFTSTVPVSGDGSYVSAPFTPTAVGTYSFTASYSGDPSNAPVATACGDPAESVLVSRSSTVVVVTKASGAVAVGGAVSDTATLSSGFGPSGTVTFALFGPGDATCSGVPAFTSTVPVSGDGSYSSAAFKPSAVGTYSFTASYSGDASNAPVATACGDPAESVVVSRAAVVVTTRASAPAAVGGQVSDTATLAGGFGPSGTVKFALFGPGDAACTGAPAFTSTVPVSGDGSYSSAPFTPTATGSYSFVASYSGDASNAAAATSCGDPTESVVVSRASTVAVVTRASAPVAVGGTISDAATLSGGFDPSGTVTFALYGPGDAACAGAPAFASTVPVSGDGSYSSAPFTPSAAGTYAFTASYSGDPSNAPVATACGDPAESVVVSRATATVTTRASASVAVGGQLSDTASVAGGSSPSGTMTFALFGPGDAACTGAPALTTSVPVSGDGTYSSGQFRSTAPGTYSFVASYSGDATNAPVTTACADPAESVVVSRATPAVTTHASGQVTIGGGVSDTATVSGGFDPTGSISFELFGPGDAACGGTPAFTSTATVAGDGTFGSGSFAPSAAGTYSFVALYSGDANNASAQTACADAAETVVVGRASPVVTTQASGGVAVGGELTDTASLSEGLSPTGTVDFSLFGPDDPTCSGPVVFASARPLAGSLSVTSDPFVASGPGTYLWEASYGGDAGNAPANAGCGGPTESTTVVRAQPTLTTSTPPTLVSGASSSDTATLAGGAEPTGTVDFKLYGPDDATCSSAIFSSSKPIDGDGSYPSDAFTMTAAGAYSWVVTYAGDADNLPASSPCGSEVVNVSPPTTTPPPAQTPPPTTTPPPAQTPPSTPPPAPTPPAAVAAPAAPTITQVCEGIEGQIDAQLAEQTAASDLRRGLSFVLSSHAGAEIRLVLSAKDPANGSIVTLANLLGHVASRSTLAELRNGLSVKNARRARALLGRSERAHANLLVYRVARCRPDHQTVLAASSAILGLTS
jgi:hypothetical protein